MTDPRSPRRDTRGLIAAVAAVAGALIYGASPVDILPEIILGPVGYLDDLLVIAAAVWFVARKVRERRERPQDDITVEQMDDD